MYCPSCANEISVELKYCNRCGANLTLPMMTPSMALGPVKLTVPSIVLGLTILGGLGIIFGGATEFARQGLYAGAIVWIVLLSATALFGCVGLMIRFFLKMMTMQREIAPPQQPPRPVVNERQTAQHLPPPRMEPVSSVTENTTRTFTPIYREQSERGTR